MKGVPETMAVDAIIDVERVLDQVQGDMALLRTLVEMFREQSAGLLADGRRAAENGDGPAVDTVAHALKSMVGNFSVGETFEAARRLEESARRGDLSHLLDRWGALEHGVDRMRTALEALTTREGGEKQ